MEAQPEIHCLGKSGLVHIRRPDIGTLCSSKTQNLEDVAPDVFVTCHTCRQIRNLRKRRAELKERVAQCPKVYRDHSNGSIYFMKLDTLGRVTKRKLPFVTMAAAEQWLAMFIKFQREHAVEIDDILPVEPIAEATTP